MAAPGGRRRRCWRASGALLVILCLMAPLFPGVSLGAGGPAAESMAARRQAIRERRGRAVERARASMLRHGVGSAPETRILSDEELAEARERAKEAEERRAQLVGSAEGEGGGGGLAAKKRAVRARREEMMQRMKARRKQPAVPTVAPRPFGVAAGEPGSGSVGLDGASSPATGMDRGDGQALRSQEGRPQAVGEQSPPKPAQPPRKVPSQKGGAHAPAGAAAHRVNTPVPPPIRRAVNNVRNEATPNLHSPGAPPTAVGGAKVAVAGVDHGLGKGSTVPGAAAPQQTPPPARRTAADETPRTAPVSATKAVASDQRATVASNQEALGAVSSSSQSSAFKAERARPGSVQKAGTGVPRKEPASPTLPVPQPRDKMSPSDAIAAALAAVRDQLPGHVDVPGSSGGTATAAASQREIDVDGQLDRLPRQTNVPDPSGGTGTAATSQRAINTDAQQLGVHSKTLSATTDSSTVDTPTPAEDVTGPARNALESAPLPNVFRPPAQKNAATAHGKPETVPTTTDPTEARVSNSVRGSDASTTKISERQLSARTSAKPSGGIGSSTSRDTAAATEEPHEGRAAYAEKVRAELPRNLPQAVKAESSVGDNLAPVEELPQQASSQDAPQASTPSAPDDTLAESSPTEYPPEQFGSNAPTAATMTRDGGVEEAVVAEGAASIATHPTSSDSSSAQTLTLQQRIEQMRARRQELEAWLDDRSPAESVRDDHVAVAADKSNAPEPQQTLDPSASVASTNGTNETRGSLLVEAEHAPTTPTVVAHTNLAESGGKATGAVANSAPVAGAINDATTTDVAVTEVIIDSLPDDRPGTDGSAASVASEQVVSEVDTMSHNHGGSGISGDNGPDGSAEDDSAATAGVDAATPPHQDMEGTIVPPAGHVSGDLASTAIDEPERRTGGEAHGPSCSDGLPNQTTSAVTLDCEASDRVASQAVDAEAVNVVATTTGHPDGGGPADDRDAEDSGGSDRLLDSVPEPVVTLDSSTGIMSTGQTVSPVTEAAPPANIEDSESGTVTMKQASVDADDTELHASQQDSFQIGALQINVSGLTEEHADSWTRQRSLLVETFGKHQSICSQRNRVSNTLCMFGTPHIGDGDEAGFPWQRWVVEVLSYQSANSVYDEIAFVCSQIALSHIYKSECNRIFGASSDELVFEALGLSFLSDHYAATHDMSGMILVSKRQLQYQASLLERLVNSRRAPKVFLSAATALRHVVASFGDDPDHQHRLTEREFLLVSGLLRRNLYEELAVLDGAESVTADLLAACQDHKFGDGRVAVVDNALHPQMLEAMRNISLFSTSMFENQNGSIASTFPFGLPGPLSALVAALSRRCPALALTRQVQVLLVADGGNEPSMEQSGEAKELVWNPSGTVVSIMLTETQFNLDPSTGGFRVESPADENANVSVPYAANKAVVYDGRLGLITEPFRFAPGGWRTTLHLQFNTVEA